MILETVLTFFWSDLLKKRTKKGRMALIVTGFGKIPGCLSLHFIFCLDCSFSLQNFSLFQKEWGPGTFFKIQAGVDEVFASCWKSALGEVRVSGRAPSSLISALLRPGRTLCKWTPCSPSISVSDIKSAWISLPPLGFLPLCGSEMLALFPKVHPVFVISSFCVLTPAVPCPTLWFYIYIYIYISFIFIWPRLVQGC